MMYLTKMLLAEDPYCHQGNMRAEHIKMRRPLQAASYLIWACGRHLMACTARAQRRTGELTNRQ